MKYIFTTFIFCILQLGVFAQSNYKPGLVVTTSGDTLTGYINYKEWDANPKDFAFKKALEEKTPEEFTPATSKYIEINGLEAYQQYAGRISKGETALNKITSMADTTTLAVNVFLKVELAGKNVKLLSYTDQIKTRYFIQDHDWNKPQELIYRTYLNADNNLGSNAIFKNQLWLTATKYETDSPKLQSEIESASYALGDIKSIITKINGIDKKELRAKQTNANSRIRFFAGAALNHTRFSVKGDHLLALAEESVSKASIGPKAVAGLDIFFNPNVQRFVFRAEISYTTASADMYVEGRDANRYGRYSQVFDSHILAVSPQFIYHIYNKDKFKINVGGGFALNKPFYSNIKETEVFTVLPDFTSTYENEDNLSFAKVYYTFPIRAGVVINKRFEAVVTYIFPVSISNYVYYTYRTASTQVGVNYLFTKSKK